MQQAGRVGDNAKCSADSHGCPSCPHTVSGPAQSGSGDIIINGHNALRIGDEGTHSSCCGANTWRAAGGSASVLLNGKQAHRKGDKTTHCGGEGSLDIGSPNVLIGDIGGKLLDGQRSWIRFTLVDDSGNPMPDIEYEVVFPDGTVVKGVTDKSGGAIYEDIASGACRISFGIDEPWVHVGSKPTKEG
jgi:uncharacterized Zn-binding protein involved in type VI secretion